MPRPVLPLLLPLLALSLACKNSGVEPVPISTQDTKTSSATPSSSTTPTPTPSSPPPAAPSATLPSAPSDYPTLDAYLAAAPERAPTLPPEITGTPGDDPLTKIPRCIKTGWSYYQCAKVYPVQGRAFVHWECTHPDTPHTRNVLCTRLARYLLQGIGGPTHPAFAKELFARQCKSDDDGYRVSCYAAAEALMFDDLPTAKTYATRGCDSPKHSPLGCASLLSTLDNGLPRRAFTINKAEGLDVPTLGSCGLWLWPATTAGRCSARVACGTTVLYGQGGSELPCTDDTADDPMTTSKDGDPAFRLTKDTLHLEDDASGRLGAFTLDGHLQ